MTGEVAACLHCGESLKKSGFGIGNEPVSAAYLSAINAAFDEERLGGCRKCTSSLAPSIAPNLEHKRNVLQRKIVEASSTLPLLSINQPHGWEYRSIGLVTAQSTTGTGLISELTTAWTDFFGVQSKVYNNKIRAGEDLCKASLRLQAVMAGGNAVLGVDVDYAEVGGQRAMLMVCMTGTAVEVINEDKNCPGISDVAEQVQIWSAEASRLDKLRQQIVPGA